MKTTPKGTSGVYAIRRQSTNQLYIGSTGRCLVKRKQEHWRDLNKGKHFNPRLQNAWTKYGEVDFEFIVLSTCEPQDATREEQKAIDTLKPYYNINPTSESSLGAKRSVESCIRIRDSKLGHKHSQDHIERIRESVRSSCRKGEDHNKAKLSNSDVAIIKANLIKGAMPKDIAILYGVSASTIRNIRLGKIWRNVVPSNDG